MKIVLGDIQNQRKSFSLEEVIKFSAEGTERKADVRGELELATHKEAAYSLTGTMVACATVGCSRCGIDVCFTIEQDFTYQLLLMEEPTMDAEYECSDEDCELMYLAEPVVETTEILSEQLMLALPVRILCDEDCNGLCDQCGTQLNSRECGCRVVSKDSPFAILKDLQNN